MILREVVGFHIVGILSLGVSLVVNIFMIAFRKDKRAVHDIIGGTYVSYSHVKNFDFQELREIGEGAM